MATPLMSCEVPGESAALTALVCALVWGRRRLTENHSHMSFSVFMWKIFLAQNSATFLSNALSVQVLKKCTRSMQLDFHNGMCVKLSRFSRKPLSHIILWSTKNDLRLMFSRSDKKKSMKAYTNILEVCLKWRKTFICIFIPVDNHVHNVF